jgi:hypothetical protein
MSLVEINGVDFTNKWSNNLPAAIDGKWYITYKATVSWAHFEAPAAKSAEELTEIASNVVVFPNPFADEININLNGLDVQRIELYSSLGQLLEIVDESKIETDLIRLDISYPGNMFFLRIETSDRPIVLPIIKK